MLEAREWQRDILEEHWSELEFLWSRRMVAFESTELDSFGLARLDGRIDAHTDALFLAGDSAAQLLSEELLGEGAHALAAGMIQLRRSEERPAREVGQALFEAEGEGLECLAKALCLGRIAWLEADLARASRRHPRAKLGQ